MKNNNIKQTIKAIILGLILSLGVGYLSAAWDVAPAGNPPTCPSTTSGCNPPLNISSFPQTKTGALTLLHLFTPDLTVANSDGSISGIPNGSILTADGNDTGHVKWITTGTGYHYNVAGMALTPVFRISTNAPNPDQWVTVSYPAGVPSTAKAIILRAYTQANGWDVNIEIQDGLSFPDQTVAHAFAVNNSDDSASDSTIITLPYSVARTFQAKWHGEGFNYRPPDEAGGQRANINVIGYID